MLLENAGALASGRADFIFHGGLDFHVRSLENRTLDHWGIRSPVDVVLVTALILVGGARSTRILTIAFSLTLVARIASFSSTLALVYGHIESSISSWHFEHETLDERELKDSKIETKQREDTLTQ